MENAKGGVLKSSINPKHVVRVEVFVELAHLPSEKELAALGRKALTALNVKSYYVKAWAVNLMEIKC